MQGTGLNLRVKSIVCAMHANISVPHLPIWARAEELKGAVLDFSPTMNEIWRN